MPDILITGLSDAAVAQIDRQANALGLSRNEFLRRQIEDQVAGRSDTTVTSDTTFTVADLRRASDAVSDLLDDEVMDSARR